MADFIEQSREETWQEEEQAADRMKVPYNIFGQGGKPLPTLVRLSD